MAERLPPSGLSKPQLVNWHRGDEAFQRKAAMKKAMTPAEQRFYEMAIGNGLPCKRQAVIFHDSGYFIADFVIHGKPKLIVEIDGRSHDHQKGYDSWRTRKIGSTRRYRDFRVVRFTNDDVLRGIAEQWMRERYSKAFQRAAIRRERNECK